VRSARGSRRIKLGGRSTARNGATAGRSRRNRRRRSTNTLETPVSYLFTLFFCPVHPARDPELVSRNGSPHRAIVARHSDIESTMRYLKPSRSKAAAAKVNQISCEGKKKMISFTTPEGLEVDVVAGGDASVQVICDKLNETHFEGKLPPISAFAASRIKHPSGKPIHGITLKAEEVPDLRGLGTPWLILIQATYCDFPELIQVLLHEMTHVLLPDENPYHSPKFWATLREKWLLDFDLVLGVGLNEDEQPSGLTQRLLNSTAIHRAFGI
jgi:hypothetical protein